MQITTYKEALRIVDRFAVTREPARHLGQPGDRWTVALEGCEFHTRHGEAIHTRLFVVCPFDEEGAKAEIDRAERVRITRATTERGKQRLAKRLLQLFEEKTGFPGYRGWFQVTDLVAVYNPKRRALQPMGRLRHPKARPAA